MKPKRKVWYTINLKGHWWCGQRLGWVNDLSEVDYQEASSCRTYRNKKQACRDIENMPAGTVLVQHSIKNGKEWERDYIKKGQIKCVED